MADAYQTHTTPSGAEWHLTRTDQLQKRIERTVTNGTGYLRTQTDANVSGTQSNFGYRYTPIDATEDTLSAKLMAAGLTSPQPGMPLSRPGGTLLLYLAIGEFTLPLNRQSIFPNQSDGYEIIPFDDYLRQPLFPQGDEPNPLLKDVPSRPSPRRAAAERDWRNDEFEPKGGQGLLGIFSTYYYPHRIIEKDREGGQQKPVPRPQDSEWKPRPLLSFCEPRDPLLQISSQSDEGRRYVTQFPTSQFPSVKPLLSDEERRAFESAWPPKDLKTFDPTPISLSQRLKQKKPGQ